MHNLCDRLESERGSGRFTPISTRLVASSATRAGVSCTTTSGDYLRDTRPKMPAVSEGDKASHGSHQGSRQHANGLRNVRGDQAAANERLMRLVQVHTIKSAFIAPTKRIGNLTGIAENSSRLDDCHNQRNRNGDSELAATCLPSPEPDDERKAGTVSCPRRLRLNTIGSRPSYTLSGPGPLVIPIPGRAARLWPDNGWTSPNEPKKPTKGPDLAGRIGHLRPALSAHYCNAKSDCSNFFLKIAASRGSIELIPTRLDDTAASTNGCTFRLRSVGGREFPRTGNLLVTRTMFGFVAQEVGHWRRL